VTHHSGDPVLVAMEKKIDLWRIQKLALVQKLKAIEDADGKSLLYNTLIVYTSEIGDGDAHNQENNPMLLCGQLREGSRPANTSNSPPAPMATSTPATNRRPRGARSRRWGTST
jgi:hypothetical protein